MQLPKKREIGGISEHVIQSIDHFHVESNGVEKRGQVAMIIQNHLRITDRGIGLQAAPVKAHSAKVEQFVILHCNSFIISIFESDRHGL